MNFSGLFYRGEAKFPDLLGSSSKGWPLHSPHDWPKEINNFNNLETTVEDAIRPANDNRFVLKFLLCLYSNKSRLVNILKTNWL